MSETHILECPFCHPEEVVLENELAMVIYDRFPVNPGHMLLITRRHIADFFESTTEERHAINDLLAQAKIMLDERLQPDGYNIGVNCGLAAGQTIMHLHVHLIPRYSGDMANPLGAFGE